MEIVEGPTRKYALKDRSRPGESEEIDATLAGAGLIRTFSSVDRAIFHREVIDRHSVDAEVLVRSIHRHAAQRDVLGIVEIDTDAARGAAVRARLVGNGAASAVPADGGAATVAIDCKAAAGVLNADAIARAAARRHACQTNIQRRHAAGSRNVDGRGAAVADRAAGRGDRIAVVRRRQRLLIRGRPNVQRAERDCAGVDSEAYAGRT